MSTLSERLPSLSRAFYLTAKPLLLLPCGCDRNDSKLHKTLSSIAAAATAVRAFVGKGDENLGRGGEQFEPIEKHLRYKKIATAIKKFTNATQNDWAHCVSEAYDFKINNKATKWLQRLWPRQGTPQLWCFQHR